MNYTQDIASSLDLRPQQVAAAIELLDGGDTIPFIARYRKEATGSLDETHLRRIGESLDRLRRLDDRRETIYASIESQGKMTPELHDALLAADTLAALEDLYRPYKPRRRTRADAAREKGLQGLADAILQQPRTQKAPEAFAAAYLNHDVPAAEDALAGARDIVAETISDHAEVRGAVRKKAMQYGQMQCGKIKDAEDPKEVFRSYYDFALRVDRIRPHQVLAVNRGEAEDVLRVNVEIEERDWYQPITAQFRPDRRSSLADHLEAAIQDGAGRLLLPSVARDVRRALTEAAEAHAIEVFAANLRALLSQPPLVGHVVLGIDPAYRTGCKLCVTDPTGKVLETGTIYPHAPQNRRKDAQEMLAQWIALYDVTLIAIGNGTASRETEQLVAELTRDREDVHYLIVNEAGASVYSASELARDELPGLDVSLRGAASIARRAQDPLAELVKIEPKAIGVGMYQHDVNQTQLADALAGVVEDVVNRVGVDVNTASAALLTYIAGIGPALAGRIVSYRDAHGPFSTRETLRAVKGLGPKAFKQAAGFLRIRDGRNPLDASAIHPESYTVAEQLLEHAGLTLETPPGERAPALERLAAAQPLEALADMLQVGVPTLEDIFAQLVRPGRDPREDLPLPVLRSDVLSMEDLKMGMRLHGTVRNVVDFGAFVDIGVKQDGLLHRSQIPRGERLRVGDVIEISILDIDMARERISLAWD